MPSQTEYTENDGHYADDPDFRPAVRTFPVPEGTEIKGAVLIWREGRSSTEVTRMKGLRWRNS